MTSGYWQQVVSTGLGVPDDRPLDELTAELTAMLGSPDPAQRDGIAYPALATWIEQGTYDHLLAGLGDGIAEGLLNGLGEAEGTGVFRRSFSALVLAECIARDTVAGLLPGDKILAWGDRLAGWFLREQDTRGWVEPHGWAHAIAHGADAIGQLGASRHLAVPELTVLLDVLADRVTDVATPPLLSGELDRLASATCVILRRDLVPLSVVEPWVARLASAASTAGRRGDPFAGTTNAEGYLRSLYLHVELATPAPAIRSDLLLTLVEALRSTNPHTLGRA